MSDEAITCERCGELILAHRPHYVLKDGVIICGRPRCLTKHTRHHQLAYKTTRAGIARRRRQEGDGVR